jgi:hypothetical protein
MILSQVLHVAILILICEYILPRPGMGLVIMIRSTSSPFVIVIVFAGILSLSIKAVQSGGPVHKFKESIKDSVSAAVGLNLVPEAEF